MCRTNTNYVQMYELQWMKGANVLFWWGCTINRCLMLSFIVIFITLKWLNGCLWWRTAFDIRKMLLIFLGLVLLGLLFRLDCRFIKISCAFKRVGGCCLMQLIVVDLHQTKAYLFEICMNFEMNGMMIMLRMTHRYFTLMCPSFIKCVPLTKEVV